MRSYWVYILASKPRGTLYIGVTNGIIRRVEQHRAGKASSFTRKYKVRAWKVNLIEGTNPHWADLYPSLPGVRPPSIKGASGWMGPGDKPRDDT